MKRGGMSRLLSSLEIWISIRIMRYTSERSLYTPRLSAAIRFSIKTHEVYQKQKRKGKDIPYITHPLIVGLILARAGCDEDVVIAGILHDTIEDSPDEKKVTKEMLAERFGERVAGLVDAVTEQDKSLSWEERKRVAFGHIAHFSHDELLVKSADIISNTTEIIDDVRKHGEETFSRFNASMERILGHTIAAIEAALARWPDNPLSHDLADRATALRRILEGAPNMREGK
jgi:(p)ppGpp synthase/HD superfamily hydrolase